MFGVFLILVFAAILIVVMVAAGVYEKGARLPVVLLIGYFIRPAIQLLTHEVQLFSHDTGGDYYVYNLLAKEIAFVWEQQGFHYVTAEEIPDLGMSTLPSNLFAAVMYVSDDATSRFACTALIAFAAALTVINIFSLSLEFGAARKAATTFAIIFYFQPSFLFYTSDMFKDGLVLCFLMGALGSALRLSRKFTLHHAIIGVVCLLALWQVRFYLVFIASLTLLIGITGVGAKQSGMRTTLALGLVVVSLVVLGVYSNTLDAATARAAETFEHATSEAVVTDNALGGSGVTFNDGGNPFGALHLKVLYTLFSPFPWSAGSIGFQLGKFDAFLWYYVAYRAIQAARTANRQLVWMLAAFIGPCTLMYATSMSNIGLIVRQRLVIVAATFILASMYDPKKAAAAAAEAVKPKTDPLLERARVANRARFQ